MNQLSHYEPINLLAFTDPSEMASLTDAFAEFISVSARLEDSYSKLQAEVAQLSHELADRNAALNASLVENERVHRALQQIVDSMPCGVLVLDANESVTMINPEGRRLLDLAAEGVPSLDAISRHSGIDLRGLPRQLACDDEKEFFRDLSGGERWLAVRRRQLHTTESFNSVPHASPAILILRDITAHKRAEQDREQARKAIALSEVAATLAHEIRNPLTSLELFAGLIEQGGEESAEWISHLRAGIRSLAGTVNNVLSFHGMGFPPLAPLNLIGSIRNSMEFVRPIADEAGIRLGFLSHEPEISVLGNSNALQQLVLNIVCNAIRHSLPGGRVEVTASRDRRPDGGSIVRIEFADNGRGIAQEHLEEIFRAGFSVDGASSGLGLAVCRQIANLHDGSIHVASTLGRGTTFFVEMPTL